MTRLSPSSTVITRGGRPTRCPMAVAATASVGLTTAPSAMASAKEMLGNTPWTTAPIASAETITITTDSQEISRSSGGSRGPAVHRGRVEQRRQHPGQDDLRLEGDGRRTRQVAGADAQGNQQQRRRDPGPPREHRRRDHDREPGPGNQNELMVHVQDSRAAHAAVPGNDQGFSLMFTGGAGAAWWRSVNT